MNLPSPISTEFQWFRLFYVLAIALGALLVLRAARRDGLPVARTLALFLWVAVFGMLGARLLTMDLGQIGDFLRSGMAPDTGKTMLGGLLGGMLGLALGRKVMGIGAHVWGWFAAWPAVLIVFRLGCLAVGCCAGTVTDMPWALHYGAHSQACELQIAHGLLPAHAAQSLAVHPVPLYEIALAVLLLLGGWQLYRRGWSMQRLFFLSLPTYAAFRFVEEFIRVEQPPMGPLNAVQWGLLAAFPLLLILALRRPRTSEIAPQLRADWLVALAPLAVAFACRKFWSPGEAIAVGGLVIAFGLAKAWEWGKANAATRVQLRWVAPASLLAGTLFMGQAAIDQTVPADGASSVVELGVGAAYGRYQEACGDNHRYGTAGAGVQYTHNWGGKHQLDAGVRGFYGTDDDGYTQLKVYGGNPFVAYQNRFVGVEVGAALGQLLTNGERRTVLPSAVLRLGPSDIFFAEGRIQNNSAFTPVPGSAFRVGIGSGFGIKNGTNVSVGFGLDGFYAQGHIVIQRNWVLEPMASIGDQRSYLLGLGARVRLGL